jgi:hypothetical protein
VDWQAISTSEAMLRAAVEAAFGDPPAAGFYLLVAYEGGGSKAVAHGDLGAVRRARELREGSEGTEPLRPRR